MNAPRNLTRKLLSDHLLEGDLVPGEEIDLSVDQILIEDATGSMTALQFEALGADSVGHRQELCAHPPPEPDLPEHPSAAVS